MLQKTAVFAPLFTTFAPDKLEHCLSEQRKRRFPFLQKARTKKLSSYGKIKTEQNIIEKDNQESVSGPSLIKIEVPQHKTQISSIQPLKLQNCQQNPAKKNDLEKLRSNRIVLPSVFDKNFLQGNVTRSKRSASSEASSRFSRENRRATIETKMRYEAHQEGNQEAPLKRFTSIEYREPSNSIDEKYGELLDKKIRKRISYAADVPVVDTKIIQAISRMKKIYN